jgi:hypothetical protein
VIWPIEVHAAQERVVFAEPANECLDQWVDLGAHPTLGHLSQDLRVAFTGDQPRSFIGPPEVVVTA